MLRSIIKTLLLYGLLFYSLSSVAAFWTDKELRILKSFQLNNLSKQPPAPTNQYAYHDAAANFGKQLFFDKRFSANGAFACASCHQPNKAFTDGLKKAKGVHKTGRNTQTLLGVKHQEWFYWDGRKDSLWAQALVPFEAADEMASSRVQVLRLISLDKQYRKQYETLFGELPKNLFSKNIKANAGPWGNTQTRDNWYRIPANTKKQINRAYANIGKAVAAYERTIPLPKTKLDTYLEALFDQGEKQANNSIKTNALAGLKLFIDQSKTHCMRCHNGPLFSNGGFHNIGTGNFKGKQLDFGRFLGIQAVVQDPFNCLSEYSDAKPEQCTSLRFLPKQVHDETQGAYKTPTLRYLNQTSPYFHDGRFNDLDTVLQHYTNIKKGSSELPELNLSKLEIKQLKAFLQLLNTPSN